MDHRFSVRGAAQERAARRRLIYLLLRNGDIGTLAGPEESLREHGPASALVLPAPDAEAPARERPVGGQG